MTFPDANSKAVLTAERVRALALEVGFSEAGLVALPYAGAGRDAERFAEWVRTGRAGTMGYLMRAGEDGELLRARLEKTFPWARSAVVCFAGYHCEAPLSTETQDPRSGWIARYAWSGRTDASGTRRASDYHKVLRKRLNALEARLREESSSQVLNARSGVPRELLVSDELSGFEARGFVDTGPVVERSVATAAGVGWTGKNTCLIHPRLGSFGFLAVLLTSLPVQEEKAFAPLPDRCGSCTRCLEACPTGALTAPYQMDAARCIAYLTIEHRGPIDAALMEGMGRQIFGCDICQDVCPWNSLRRVPVSADPELAARDELVNPALEGLAAMEEAEFERLFNGSPVRRAGFKGLRRNLAVAMGNSGVRSFAARLQEWLGDADEGVRAGAEWALGKLKREP